MLTALVLAHRGRGERKAAQCYRYTLNKRNDSAIKINSRCLRGRHTLILIASRVPHAEA
jgi:hypothetical protein